MLLKDWKKNFFKSKRKQIASIAFLRNIVEMTQGNDDPRFVKLTAMLHWKKDTDNLSIQDLDNIFNSLCAPNGVSEDSDKKIVDLIMDEANACVEAGASPELEDKIVLAIATRLAAEKFIIEKVNNAEWVASITKHQTRVLIDRYRVDFSGDDGVLRVLDRVELMTPENIHVNAFMYEPIIDMGVDQLCDLYRDVVALA